MSNLIFFSFNLQILAEFVRIADIDLEKIIRSGCLKYFQAVNLLIKNKKKVSHAVRDAFSRISETIMPVSQINGEKMIMVSM